MGGVGGVGGEEEWEKGRSEEWEEGRSGGWEGNEKMRQD